MDSSSTLNAPVSDAAPAAAEDDAVLHREQQRVPEPEKRAEKTTEATDKKNAAAPGPPQENRSINIVEHLLSIPEVAAKFNVQVDEAKPSGSQGLSAAEAAKRLEENGPNMLTPPKKKHPFFKFMECLLGVFNLMLIASGVAAYITLAIDYKNNFSNTYLGAILIVVAFMNAAIEFFQLQKSQSILESFLNLIPAQCHVIRDGRQQQISAKDLVLGDVVVVKMGDKVPADVFLVGSTDLKVDNSSLTGEAEPQERGKRNTMESPLEAHNLVFNGTLCVNGEGVGIVIRTGDHTVIGQIASLTTTEQRRESPMSMEIEHFVYTIASVAAIVAIVFFIVAMVVKGQSFSVALSFAIGTFVSFVPEGLPATVIALLTVASQRMAARKVLVKDLQGVETLGAITLLATDKTGTLTRNQMTVTYLWSGNRLYLAPNQATHSQPEGEPTPEPLDLSHAGANEVVHMAALCSRASFDRTDCPISERQVHGDATEAGLLRCAAGRLADFDVIRDKFPKVFEIPFNSENKWAMTIHAKPHSRGTHMLYIKGAPERILRLCTTFFDGKEAVPLSAEHRERFDSIYAYMAGKGHRVLAFAALAMPEEKYPKGFEFVKDPANFPTTGFTFYGLVSLEDPPKHGVREAIGRCRSAGIKVMMVTGDHPLTAEAIARKINLVLSDTRETLARKRNCDPESIPESDVRAVVIHGERIDTLTDADWETILDKDEIIFARTSPKHKLEIVKRAQARGHIVGVTGDGVNDSPALKKADLGIAMNESGSDVSKEAAAMILLDDNFASTVAGIEEGRLIFQNLKKSITYTVTHTMPEVYANLMYIAVPLPLPLAAVQILVVDLGFELLMALSYAYDPSENREGLMKLPPRKPVTPGSIDRLRRLKALEVRESGIPAVEGVEPPTPTRLQKVVRSIRRLTSPARWAMSFEPTEEETLVDGDLLSYSYLEAGTIQAIGCFAAYFFAIWYHSGLTPTQVVRHAPKWGTDAFEEAGQTFDTGRQAELMALGQSAFYLAIMLQQAFNLFVCKARLGYPFGKAMFANVYTFVGLGLGAALTMLVVYVPPFNVAFLTSYHLTPLAWLVGAAGGVTLFAWGVVRMALKMAFRPVRYSREVVGLQMFPTRWSTGGGK
ncbi:hypothetical protein HDU96_003267 [Phlyctochytrium bullatum]|nr:hypothetical protein HDU96_003267 [Phlyctochytrium bullatum]